MLEYGIDNKAGFSVICGEIGCGKTTLVRHLLNNLGSNVTVGIVYNTHQQINDLLALDYARFWTAPMKGCHPLHYLMLFQQFFN